MINDNFIKETQQTCVNKSSENKSNTGKVNGNKKELLTIKQAPIYKRPFK